VPATLDDALASAAQLGPFFTIAPLRSRDAEQAWWPLDALPADVLTRQLAATSGFLGTGDSRDESRTLGSILHLGAAAALCSPLLAVAAQHGFVPALTAANVDVGYPPVGPLRVSLNAAPTPVQPARLPELADQLIAVALDGLLEPFTARLTAIEPLPEQTLAGNAFSSLAAAARLIEPAAAGRRARVLVDLMSRRSPLLTGAGDLHWQQLGGHEYFRRRNCCLFYRIPGAGTCGDCILD
jgi:hypothetical protein